MNCLESGRAAILFLKVGFVVFAIFFCCFVLEPEKPVVADVVCADDRNNGVAPVIVNTSNVHAHHQAKFRLPFAIFSLSHELTRLAMQRPAIASDFHAATALFLTLLTINAP